MWYLFHTSIENISQFSVPFPSELNRWRVSWKMGLVYIQASLVNHSLFPNSLKTSSRFSHSSMILFSSDFWDVNVISQYESPVPNMPQQRSDQHHPPGTPTMMHPATAAGPPIVAPSPAYSAQYFTCSPQQFTSQPLVQQMTHYQSQVRFTLSLPATQHQQISAMLNLGGSSIKNHMKSFQLLWYCQ